MRSVLAQLMALALALAASSVAPAARAESAPAVAPRTEAPVQREVDRLVAWLDREHGQASVMVIELEGGKVLAKHDAGAALNPASNAKVLTAATALSVLGADHRFQFGLYGTVESGYAPRVVLRSDGDPSLTSRELERLAKRLVDDGLQRVGEILVDQSRFDDQFTPPAFEQQPNEWAAFRAPVSAVALDRNSFVVKVEPGKEGAGARVTVFPDGYVELDNQVTTRKKGQGRKLAIELSPKGHGLGAKLTGHVSVGDRALSFQRRIEDPTLYAGYALRKMLERLGVTVEGGVSEGGKDETHLLVERRSEPLSKLLTELGKDSDNYYAETVLKAIGAKISSKRGSSASGADAVKAHLASLGALDSATRIVNGSGLFDANRVSADTLVKVLAAWASRPAFVDQLAVGGVDGTLKHRFRGTRGRIRAKTGTLARAHSLSGYVLDDHGKPKIAFAILLNGVAGKADQQRRWIDKIVEAARRATH